MGEMNCKTKLDSERKVRWFWTCSGGGWQGTWVSREEREMGRYELSGGGRGKRCGVCGGRRGKWLRVLAWVSGKEWCCAPRRALDCGEGGRSFGRTLDFSDRIIDQVGMWMASGLRMDRIRREREEREKRTTWAQPGARLKIAPLPGHSFIFN